MATKVTAEMFKDLVTKGPIPFFSHTLDKGDVELVFTSDVHEVHPGQVDLAGKEWEPKTTDKDGNPLVDKFTGKLKEPWSKFEALCTIKGIPHLYSFNKSNLRTFGKAIWENSLDANNIIGTKWIISRLSDKEWKYTYLGTEAVDSKPTVPTQPTSKSTPQATPTPVVPDSDPVKAKINQFKASHPKTLSTSKNSLIQYLCFETELKPLEAETKLNDLVKSGFLKENADKIIF